MAKTKKNIKRRKRTLKKKFNKRGGNPQANLKKKTNKIIKDEFSQSFVIAGDVGYSPRAPEAQAMRTLYLRESQKKENRKEKKSKVTGFEKAQKSDSGLMSAIKQGYASGLTGAAALRSRGQSALQTLGGITGAMGGPSRIPTSMGEIGKLTSQLVPPGKKVKGMGRKGINTRAYKGNITQVGKRSTGLTTSDGQPLSKNTEGGPPLPPDVIESDTPLETNPDLPPLPPDVDEVDYCPVCGNKIKTEMEEEEIMSKFSEMTIEKVKTLDSTELKEYSDKVKGLAGTFVKKLDKEKNTRQTEIKEQEEKEAAERNKKRKEKAKKMKNKIEPIKEKCLAVGDIKKFNNNATGKLSDLLEELEEALQN